MREIRKKRISENDEGDTGSKPRGAVLAHLGPPLPFLRIAGQDRQHGVHARIDAAREIALLELRRDGRGDDDLGQRIRQRALEAVADLDAQLALVGRDQKQHAVVVLLLPELPVPEEAVGVILDARAVERGTVATTTWSVVLSS